MGVQSTQKENLSRCPGHVKILLDNSNEMKMKLDHCVWHYDSPSMTLKRVISLEQRGRKPDLHDSD